MSHSILITGGSGYLGGTLLAHLARITLPPHKKLYTLVRSKEQSEAVKQYGVKPLLLDLEDEESVTKSIVAAQITIVYFLIDASGSHLQIPAIKALSEVKKLSGQEVHFLHALGAKMFSEHAAFPIDRTILDTDPTLYELQKSTKPPYERMVKAVHTNNTIIETAEAYGVRSYIFIPCIVYGEGEGFGNRISIQTTAVVKAAKKVGAIHDVNADGAVNHSEDVLKADDGALEDIAQALGCPKELVAVQIGGTCTLQSHRASKIGWKPEYPPEHILEAADAEVDLILTHLGEKMHRAC